MADAGEKPAQFKLLYFAAASTYAKKQSEMFPAPLKISELFGTLEKQYPGIQAKVLESCAVTVNLEYVDLDEGADSALVIKEGDEVAIIPPAGGILAFVTTTLTKDNDMNIKELYHAQDVIRRAKDRKLGYD